MAGIIPITIRTTTPASASYLTKTETETETETVTSGKLALQSFVSAELGRQNRYGPMQHGESLIALRSRRQRKTGVARVGRRTQVHTALLMVRRHAVDDVVPLG